MKKSIIGFIVILNSCFAIAADGEFAVIKIAPDLLKNANVVKRNHEIRFEVINNGEALMKEKWVLTILNENGSKYADLSEYYDKFHEIINIEGTLFDATGKAIGKLKNKDIQDVSGVSGLMDDARYKVHNFYHRVYPYTVEYEIESKYKNTMFFPTWVPQNFEKLAVEKSSISIITSPDYVIRFKPFNYKDAPQESQEKNKKVLSWKVNNMTAIETGYASPDWRDLTTMIYFGPTAFEVEKYKGNMATWQDFGKFVYTLTQGRDALPDNIKQTVHKLCDGLPNNKQKVEALYNFMQQNTRYISVQLGIGGWQPFDASYVANKRYGDCKALSNYMYSLLKEAGIKSYYTLIKAGDNVPDLVTDFPSSQFNHAILCVPQSNDTIWLECTSQTVSPGYMGDFTGNRYALLIDEKGGTLVRTPKYDFNQNSQTRHINAVLDVEGTLTMKTATRYNAQQQDNLHGFINALSKDKVQKILQEQLDFPTYDLVSFEYKENRDKMPSIDESLSLTVSNYANITGKRLFITPNIMSRTRFKPKNDEERKTDIFLRYEYNDIDSVEIIIPQGYMLESNPADVSLVSSFGKYTSSVKLKDNKIVYYRNVMQFSGRFPASEYPVLVKYYEAMHKADRNKMVLVKKMVLKLFKYNA